jgi:4-aminobutyrate aminotransferase-like enzyme
MGELYRQLMVHRGINGTRGRGLFLAVEFNGKIDGKRLMKNIFENRIILDQFLFCSSAFRIAPPLIITEEEVQESSALLLDALEKSLI